VVEQAQLVDPRNATAGAPSVGDVWKL